MSKSLDQLMIEHVKKREEEYAKKPVQYFSDEYLETMRKLSVEDRAKLLDEYQQMHYFLQKNP